MGCDKNDYHPREHAKKQSDEQISKRYFITYSKEIEQVR